MRDLSLDSKHISPKRTRQSSRSNSGCSSEDEATTNSGIGHKRTRLDVHNSYSSHQSSIQDPLTSVMKLKDPTRIYNFGYRKKPAELFRKDLISAMKMADSEQLNDGDYITIVDHWKEEWEKGVQVPVNPDALPSASYRALKPVPKSCSSPNNHNNTSSKLKSRSHMDSNNADSVCSTSSKFKLPRDYIKDAQKPSENLKYELDLIDLSWRELMSETCVPPISDSLIEDVITELERQCAENMKNNKIGIEFNDGVVCDVCRSPYSEDGNEMIFCDTCNVCVHQACYDIDEIPSGEWYCQPCRELGRVDKASCMLCPNKNGAMKRTSDDKWAHVSCSLWVVSQIDGDHKDHSSNHKNNKPKRPSNHNNCNNSKHKKS